MIPLNGMGVGKIQIENENKELAGFSFHEKNNSLKLDYPFSKVKLEHKITTTNSSNKQIEISEGEVVFVHTSQIELIEDDTAVFPVSAVIGVRE